MARSIFRIFWHKTFLTITERVAKNFFQFLSSQRPIFLGIQSSASSSDLLGQGEQFSDYFCVY